MTTYTLMISLHIFLYNPFHLTSVGVCPMHQFRCENGTCIPIMWACDGINDCGDNSDEEKHCRIGIFSINLLTYKDTLKFTQIIFFDVFHYNFNLSIIIGGLLSTCPESHFLCSNMKCINGAMMCDGKDDCGDQSDEIIGCKGTKTSFISKMTKIF